MRDKKEAPTACTVQGRTLLTNEVYHTPGPLSMAAQIILLIEQAPACADRLRAACWDKLERTLRRHYTERGANNENPC